ncbi:THUMP domain-containing protein 3 [Linnemannia zychae]|nr:THUMP domain-containing protein 3 [Linnemannia zychae]
MTSTPNMKEITESNPNTGTMKATPVRFRASFDRGDIQHRGVRSQDLAAALGGLTGDAFPSWKVNLKDYDVEIMGRWIQEDLEQVVFKNEHKPNITSNQFILPEGEINDEDQPWNKCSQTVQFEHTQQQQQEVKDEFIKIQVGIALPLALSTCPYRFRPLDGRTSLRIEIAYTLLALAAPKPGDVVVDTCSGVGTIPIVGAAHYPKSWFIGLEIQSANVEKAIHNAHEMMSKISNYRRQEQTIESFANRLTNLPWGKRENSHVYNCKLYPRLMREIIRLLKVDGRAVLITGERKLLQRQLDAPFAKPFLKVLQKREISIGYKVMVFELLRI